MPPCSRPWTPEPLGRARCDRPGRRRRDADAPVPGARGPSAPDAVVLRHRQRRVPPRRRPRGTAEQQIEREVRWLPVFRESLSTTVPEVVAVGQPAEGFPHRWTVQRWIDGQDAVPTADADWVGVARSLAAVVGELRDLDPTDGPVPGPTTSGRGTPLVTLDEHVRRCAAATRDLGDTTEPTAGLDVDAALDLWAQAVEAPAWAGPPVWFHGDLTPGNVLLRDGKLAAVIDVGCAGVGDPACDGLPTWTLFSGDAREEYRRLTHLDPATDLRTRGWAVFFGLTAMPHHHATNPAFCRTARRVVDAVCDVSGHR
ncbi:aminoglycoside phosphotransferase family protein [Kineococcus sp. NPDC059986]|uniref:aminoglycoside phosphotransferase family protein n=1 Tax=Kineococcus sp. NPDC059986 TaxID=3155538 RepID=UPI00344E89CB